MRPKSAFFLVFAVAVSVIGMTLTCKSLHRESAPHPNVILISIDTLRPDHLGCYGYEKNTSPHIDEFRRDSVLFREVIAQAPSTLPSHASIFTSLLPHHHGASVANSYALPEELLTLAEVLKQHGYATVSYNGGIHLDPIFGLSQGFDTYVSARPSTAGAEVLVGPLDRFDHVVESATDWLEAHRAESFFLFLHTYEVHHPYTPDEPTLGLFETDYQGDLSRQVTVDALKEINEGKVALGGDDLQHIIHAYDAEIRSVDTSFQRLLRYLRQKGLYESALVIFTSDHGEEFGEHGMVGWHSHSLYDELLRVPLVLKLPHSQLAGTSVETQVRSIDIAPTVLSALGIDIPLQFQGANLLEARGEEPFPSYAVSKQDVAGTEDVSALRTREWKWYRGKLFHLASDERERFDVSSSHPVMAEELRLKLQEIVASRPRPKATKVQPSEELEERLRSLGYIK